MWIIISILLGVVCLISLGVQHEQRKELEEKHKNQIFEVTLQKSQKKVINTRTKQ